MYKFDRESVPKDPGVYLFKNSRKEIIYVGKAKNLKNRVSSYFSKNNHSAKTQVLVKNIDDLDFIIVDNEVEALLLENKLIKKHNPKYNINLKDDKTFSYLKITQEEIPKLVRTRKVTNTGDYFGPYTDGYLRLQIERILITVFNIITNKTYSSKSRINYDIGLAPAPTKQEIDVKEYQKNVEAAKEFLKGKTAPILKRLEQEMLDASSKNLFEVAKQKKNQIEAIYHISQKQKVDTLKNYDQDVMVILHNKQKASLIQVFNITRGVISNKKEYRFDYYEDDLLENFIKVYYSKKYVPKEILINQKIWQTDQEQEVITEYLSKFRGSKVILNKPQKGDKLSLIKLAIKNAKLSFGDNDVLIQMKNKIGLPTIPKVIECFDMSNLGSEHLVGAMTRWVDAQRDVRGSRKFLIKSFKGRPDDFAAMKEVVRRRYSKLKKDKTKLPDLILIDGGKGQLKVSVEALKEVGVKIPIISLAKRDEEIFVLGKKESLKFDRNSSMMLLIRQIRDSVHNYVLAYNRKRREMKLREEMKK